MAIDSVLRDRLSKSVSDLDERRLQARFDGIDVSSIAELPLRAPARFGGEVRSQHRSAAGIDASLKIVVSDGTGSVTVVFTGRQRIRGFEAGRAVLFEGVVRREGERLVALNPAYTLLA